MPWMRPPSYSGLLYNQTKIAPGALVDVLDRDVADLESQGWEISTPARPERPPKADRYPAEANHEEPPELAELESTIDPEEN